MEVSEVLMEEGSHCQRASRTEGQPHFLPAFFCSTMEAGGQPNPHSCCNAFSFVMNCILGPCMEMFFVLLQVSVHGSETGDQPTALRHPYLPDTLTAVCGRL